MIVGVDHALIAVEDLDAGMRTYEQLGFQVMRGGSHPQHGTHNALVPLADGFYLELMGVWDGALARQHPHTNRVLEALNGDDRLALFALDSDDLDADVAQVRQRGLGISDPVPGERERPDGERVAWRTAHPTDPRLPFLIADVTPRSVRVPTPDAGIGPELEVDAMVAAAQPQDVDPYAQLLGAHPQNGPVALSRGTVDVDGTHVGKGPNRLIFATDDLDQLRADMASRAIPFAEAGMSDGRRAVVPRTTLGVSLWMAERHAQAGH